jgi:hypothetical protein
MRYKFFINIFNTLIKYINLSFIFQAKKYLISRVIYGIYGISQNPDTKDYIIVLQDDYCKSCVEIYAEIWCKWCKSCQINNLKQNFVNWTSGNEKIDDFIQEMQLKIKTCKDIIVEWIPYNQFNYIKEIGKGDFAIIYSAIWMDGPLIYNGKETEYKREPNIEVVYLIHKMVPMNF